MEHLYLITGDDDYEKNKYLEQIKKEFGTLTKGINYIQIDKDNMWTLEQELSTYSFLCEDKLIVVKLSKKETSTDDEQSNKKDWFNKDIEEQIRNKLDFIWLVFYEESGTNTKLNKLIAECGKCSNFDKSKPHEMVKWIVSKVNSYGVSVDNYIAEYLIEICGTDKIFLDNEINKLANCVGENQKITKEIIDKMCIKTSEIIIFDLIDCIGSKNAKVALRYLDELIENKEPIQKIMIMVYKHFKMLLLAKEALKERKDVAIELNVKPYPAKKYATQCRNFTSDELLKILEELARLDVDSKNGKMDLKIGLQKIICM